jgi:hypothetical protein
MSNMSYCRFKNTIEDLRDCFDNMDEQVSLWEHKKREQLIKLCHQIAESYIDEETGKPVELDHDETD